MALPTFKERNQGIFRNLKRNVKRATDPISKIKLPSLNRGVTKKTLTPTSTPAPVSGNTYGPQAPRPVTSSGAMATTPARIGAQPPSGYAAKTVGTKPVTPSSTSSPYADTTGVGTFDFSSGSSPSPYSQTPTQDFSTQGARTGNLDTRTEERKAADSGLTGGSSAPGGFNYSQYQPNANLQSARDRYIASLSPSAEETQLQQDLATLEESYALGISGLEGQGRGISAGLVRGQQAKLNEQGEIKKQGIIAQLNALSGERKAASDAALAEMNIAQQDAATQQQQQQFQQQFAAQQASQNKPFEFNGNLVAYDPATGQLKTIATGQAVQPGTDDIQEYQFAVQTGFGGSFLDYLQQKSGSGASGDYKPFSVSEGSSIYDPATGQFIQAPGGGSGAQKPLSAEASKLIANAQSGLDAINTMSQTLPGFFGRSGIGLGSSREYNAAKENLVDIIGRMRSGGAITEDESKRFEQFLPSPLDSEDLARKKLTDMQNLLNQTIQGVTGGQQGYDQNYDPLDLGFSSVGGDTKKAIQNPAFTQAIKQTYPQGKSAGQCGRFTNQLTGLGVGDTFESKMAKVDPRIGREIPPRPGDVFVMPYSWTGHIGLVESIVPKPDGSYDLNVVDSNWGLDEKVQYHTINSSKISGYARPNQLKLA